MRALGWLVHWGFCCICYSLRRIAFSGKSISIEPLNSSLAYMLQLVGHRLKDLGNRRFQEVCEYLDASILFEALLETWTVAIESECM